MLVATWGPDKQPAADARVVQKHWVGDACNCNSALHFHGPPVGWHCTCALVQHDGLLCLQKIVKESFGISDLSLLACDPWSVHIAQPEEYAPLHWRKRERQQHNGAANGKAHTNGVAYEADNGFSEPSPPARLVQLWLYRRDDADDNHYSKPLPLLPVVDLNARKVVALQVCGSAQASRVQCTCCSAYLAACVCSCALVHADSARALLQRVAAHGEHSIWHPHHTTHTLA